MLDAGAANLFPGVQVLDQFGNQDFMNTVGYRKLLLKQIGL